MTEERWLPVVGFDLYEVSDHGRVRSVDRMVPTSYGRYRKASACLLKPQMRNKYHVVQFGRKTRYVHDLVLEAFVGPKPLGNDVRHGQLGRLNNSLANLCYGTRSDNEYDKVLDGTHQQASKTECPKKHPYDGQRTRANGYTYRYCKRCKNEQERKRYASKHITTQPPPSK